MRCVRRRTLGLLSIFRADQSGCDSTAPVNESYNPTTHPHLRVHAGTESADELKGVQGIGAKSRAKIQEIIETGACGSVTFSFWFFFF